MNSSLMGRTSPRPARRSAAADRRSLPLLGRLLDRIGRIDASSPPGEGAPPARWEDENYVYFEADFPEPADCEADITVHGGRVFIRLEK